MAISFIQAASANAATVAISSTLAGDLIVVMAYNNAAATAPTVPAGYTSITSTTSTLEGGVLAYRISPGGDTSVPTFTNATNITAAVYRGCQGIGANGTATVGNSATISYPTLTPQNTSGSSWVVGAAGAKAATAGMTGTTAALIRNRTNQTTVNSLDTNAGVTSFAAQSLTVTGSGRWIGFSVELVAFAGLEDGDPWGGFLHTATRIAVTVALAANLTTATIAQQTANLDNESPAGALLNGNPGPDSSWVPPLLVQSLDVGYQYTPDDAVQPPAFVADEDYWLNPAGPLVYAPWLAMQQMFFGAGEPNTIEEIGTDEDYWNNPTTPVPATLIWPQQWTGDTQDEVQLQAEEDYWQNWVAPVPLIFGQLYLPDPEEIPAASLLNALPGPDGSTFSIVNNFPADYRYVYSPDELVSVAAPFVPDEDYWLNPTGPIISTPWLAKQIFLADDGTSVEQISTDEDYWQNPTAPLQLTLTWPQPFSFEQNEPTYIAEEDYWQNSVAPLPATLLWPLPSSFDNEQQVLHLQAEEDYWQNPATPVPLTFLWPQPWTFDNQEKVAVQAEEDYWINPVAPVAATFLWPQPFAFDPSEILPRLEEDYWQNSVSPLAAIFTCPQQFSFSEGEETVEIIGVDEDYWQTLVAPVRATLIWPQPFSFQEGSDSVSQIFVDEFYWLNPVAPVPSTFYQKLPYQPDPSDTDQPAAVPMNPTEAYWQNPTAPWPNVFLWPMPFSFDVAELPTIPQFVPWIADDFG
jgi:hypothetical protein